MKTIASEYQENYAIRERNTVLIKLIPVPRLQLQTSAAIQVC